MANEEDEARITKGVLLEIQEVYRWWKRTGTNQIQQALDALDGSDFAPPEWVILTENLMPGANAEANFTKWDGLEHISNNGTAVEIHDPFKRNFGLIGDVFQVQLNRRNGRLECVGSRLEIYKGQLDADLTTGNSGWVSLYYDDSGTSTDTGLNAMSYLDDDLHSDDLDADQWLMVQYKTHNERWEIVGKAC